MSVQLFADLRVRDFAAARAWYKRLLGQGLVTALVEDLDAQVAVAEARGLAPDERVTYSNGVRKAVFLDPDGNEVGFGAVPPPATPSAPR